MNLEIAENAFDLVCLSHLRWNFVWQRPQHLLSRFARTGRVFFVEEPVFTNESVARLEINRHESNVTVVVPHIPDSQIEQSLEIQRELLDQLLSEQNIKNFILWFYTPLAYGFAAHLKPQITIYDCMDELSAFKGAPPELLEREKSLFTVADAVFTGGQSIYEAKKDKHPRVYAFPSSIEVEHFERARTITAEPSDQQSIEHPRLGFVGVIDERFDAELLKECAALRPDWQFVMIGPVVKISPDSLPQAANIHYLGGKKYEELPAYLAGWDVALLLFALNEATRFISPTKTPEYLAAGLPVVSTPIRDVVRPYGDLGLVHIADTPIGFVQSCEAALEENRSVRLLKVDEFLSHNSWDKTQRQMYDIIVEIIQTKQQSDDSAQVAQIKSAV